MPLPFRHPTVVSQVNDQIAFVVLRVSQTVQHRGTDKLDPDWRALGIGDSGPSANDRNAVERLIEGIDLDPQDGINLAQNEPPPFVRRFLVFPLIDQTDSRISGTLLHSLIWRVLSAALNCSLNARGKDGGYLLLQSGAGQEIFLAEHLPGQFVGESQLRRAPLEGLMARSLTRQPGCKGQIGQQRSQRSNAGRAKK